MQNEAQITHAIPHILKEPKYKFSNNDNSQEAFPPRQLQHGCSLSKHLVLLHVDTNYKA